MPESFGVRLRRRREEQGIDLVTIAKQTKIKQSLLEALERDDVSDWPSGFYRRAFIRAYAHAIGLDPNVVVREFQEVHPEPPEVDVIAAMASALNGTYLNPRSPNQVVRDVVGSAIGSLSRLRRSHSVDDEVIPDTVPNNRPVPAAPEQPVDRRPAPATVKADRSNDAISDSVHVADSAPSEPDLQAVARLCTEFGRVGNTSDVQPLLQETARILDAVGVIVWLWDASDAQLLPAMVYGYSDKVVSQLPAVRRDADNATAAAFRSSETCAVSDSPHGRGALVVPLLTPTGCAGVLAIELQRGSEQTPSIRAVATIVAALLAQLTVGVSDVPVPPECSLPRAESL